MHLIFVRNKALKWYLRGGVPLANCRGAYQAKGAASAAAALSNLANPGTFDLQNGTAYPTWDAATGWTFAAASSQYLTIASALMAGVPISMVCRFQSADITTVRLLMSICDTGVGGYFALYCDGATAGDPIISRTYGGGGGSSATTASGYTAGAWYTAAGVFTSATLRAAYINGGSKGTDVVSRTPSGLDTTYIGTYYSGGALSTFLNGKIAACAFYNIALSDAQVLAIHNAMMAL